MGVSASMSISLLDRGELWGLIACHHYSGPHRPPYEIRVAAEFLGQTLSLRRMVDTPAQESTHVGRGPVDHADPAHGGARREQTGCPVADAGQPERARPGAAGGAVVSVEGLETSVGDVPRGSGARAGAARGRRRARGAGPGPRCPRCCPDSPATRSACGALVLTLPDDQFVVWCRPELVQTVSWGGDPRNAAVAYGEDDTVRISPRKSFELWQETVRGRSETWTSTDVELAGSLRRALVEALYARSRRVASTAMLLQRSLLPEQLPAVAGWTLAAEYQPLLGGAVGGDWYDVLHCPRASSSACSATSPATAWPPPGPWASCATACGPTSSRRTARAAAPRLDRSSTGCCRACSRPRPSWCSTRHHRLVRVASAGHPPVCLVPAARARALVPVDPSPPLGCCPVRRARGDHADPGARGPAGGLLRRHGRAPRRVGLRGAVPAVRVPPGCPSPSTCAPG